MHKPTVFQSIHDFVVQPSGGKTKLNCAIIFVCSGDYTFSLATTILSYEDKSPNLADHYVVFCTKDKITTADMAALHTITPKVIFVEFDDQEILGNWTNCRPPSVNRWPPIVYSKLYFPLILKYFDHVILSDTDILVCGDLCPTLNYGPLAWRASGKGLKQRLKSPVDGVSAKDSVPNGGWVLASSLLESFSPAELFKLAEDHQYTGTPDEMALGLLAFYNKIPVTCLDFIFHAYPTTWVDGEPLLIHALDKRKFWNNNIFKFLYPEWQDYYSQWISLGGSPNTMPMSGFLAFPDKRSKVAVYFYILEKMIDLYNQIKFSLPSGIVPSVECYKKFQRFWIKGVSENFYYEIEFQWPDKYFVRMTYDGSSSVISPSIAAEFQSLAHKAGNDFIVNINPKNIITAESRLSLVDAPSKRLLALINSTMLFVPSMSFSSENP